MKRLGIILVSSILLLSSCNKIPRTDDFETEPSFLSDKHPFITQEQSPIKLSLPTNYENILSLSVSASADQSEIRSYTTAGKIQVFVDYFNSLELRSASSQNSDQTNVEIYEITLQNADNSKIVLQRTNNLLRVGNGAWMEMTAEQSEQFDVLLQKHFSDVAKHYKVTVTTKTGEVEIPLYFSASTTINEFDGKIHWFCADGYGLSIIYYDEEERNKIPTLKSADGLSLNLPANMVNQLKCDISESIESNTVLYRDKSWEELKDLPKGEWFITFSVVTQGRYSVEEDRHEDARYHCAFQYVVE